MRGRQSACCFTGHRPDKLPWGDWEKAPACQDLKRRLNQAVESAYADGCRHFICGMARGADFYFAEAVLALRGEKEAEDFETVVDCDIDAFIPDGYIKNEYLKLDVYKRISAIENEEEYMDMQDELIDRFGDIPRPVENLLKVAELKATAHRAYVTEVAVNRQEIRMELYPKAKLDVSGIPGLIGEYKNALRFVQGEKPMMFYQDKRNKNKDCGPMMEKAREILERLGGLAG